MRMRFCVLMLAVMAAALTLAVVTCAQAAPTEIHGWMLNRFYAEPGNAHFEMERISISGSQQLEPDINAYVEWYYHNWVNRKPSLGSPWFLDSAFVNYKDPSGNNLRFGKGRNNAFGIVPAYPNRRHSEYGLVSETFTQERIVGLQYFGTFADKKTGFGIAAYNELTPGTRFSGTDQAFFRDDPVVPHLADKGEGKNLAFSGRLTYPVVKGGRLGASFATGKLRASDIAFLAGKDLVAAGTTVDKNNRWGVDFDYKHPKGFVGQAEYYAASESTLDFTGWDALVGYEPKDPMGIKLYARYGQLDLDPPAVTANTFTWDQQQLILSAVKPLRPNKPIWLQVEWLRNMEDPPAGVSNVDNDVFFLEVFTGF